MASFITETWLREQFGLAPGSEIHLPSEGRLTPAARTLLQERGIGIKYIDEAGRVFVDSGQDAGLADRKQVAVLTSTDRHTAGRCLLCSQTIDKKPDTLTSLDGRSYVAKNDIRLKLRGKLDSAIACAVWVQAEFGSNGKTAVLALLLADIRSALGNALKSEVSGDPMLPIAMGELDEEAIHAISHNPLKYIGHDHLVPEASHGASVARLNVLRAQIREAELAAADVFIDTRFQVTRQDLMRALNRLSSAVYVLMLLTYLAEKGQPVSLDKARSWT